MAHPEEQEEFETHSRHFLVQESGTGAPRRLEIFREHCVIGRGEACDVVLDDEAVSAKHVLVVCELKSCTAFDLNSTAGFLHNGESVRRATVDDGDSLGIGGVSFIYRRGYETRRKGSVGPSSGHRPTR